MSIDFPPLDAPREWQAAARDDRSLDDPDKLLTEEQKYIEASREQGALILPQRLTGCYEPSLIARCREKGWNGYLPDNYPDSAAGVACLRRFMQEWLADPQQTQLVFISGLEGRGKTYLAHLIAWRALIAYPQRQYSALFVRDGELRRQLDATDPGYDYFQARPRTPIESWVRDAPRVLVIDELGKDPIAYGDSGHWTGTWLEILTRLRESKRPRLVVICSNIAGVKFSEWERALPRSDGSAPVARRLTAAEVYGIHLTGRDWSQ